MQRHNKAPLPFQGQKRRWLSELRQLASTLPQGATVVDLFGGSGLCSHTIKQARPDLTVIWNDYDDYQSRLDYIGVTNEQCDALRHITESLDKYNRIDKDTPLHKAIFDYLAQQKYVDWETICSTLMFSSNGNRKLNPARHLYKCVPKSPYSADGYLDGVTRVQMDYRELMKQTPKDAILVVDPPYLTTTAERYEKRQDDAYWGLAEHLRLLNNIKGRKFIYFSSSKSEILELDATLKELLGTSYLGDCSYTEKQTNLGASTIGYKDLLITNLPLEA